MNWHRILNGHLVRENAAVWLVAGVVAACATEEPAPPQAAVAHGKWLFEHPAASPSSANAFSCATCHAVSKAAVGSRILPGAPLGGSTLRTLFWGGSVRELLPAINQCRFWFMGAQKPWLASDEAARAMWAYLEQLPGDSTPTAAFTVQGAIADITLGNKANGALLYVNACASCHGAAESGAGQIAKNASVLPGSFKASHASYTPLNRRLAFIEKVRHGPFLGYGGTMPPYSLEVLSDAQIADLLAVMEL